MAVLFSNLTLRTIVWATRAAIGATLVPQQQPDPNYEAHQPAMQEMLAQTIEDAEYEVDDATEPLPAAEDAGDNADTLRTPSEDRDLHATWTASINILWRRAADNATILAAQARDAVLDAVAKVKELGFIGTAKAIGQWMRLNPWKTALIVVPLVAVAITAIALLIAGFGPGGVVAGT